LPFPFSHSLEQFFIVFIRSRRRAPPVHTSKERRIEKKLNPLNAETILIKAARFGALNNGKDCGRREAGAADTFFRKEKIMKVPMTMLLVSVIALSQAQAKDSDLMLKKSFITSTGTTLNYLLFVPKNYSVSKKYPLVVTLHAAGSDYIYQVDNNDQAHPWIEDSVQVRWPHFIMAPGLPSGSSSWGGMMGAGTSLSPEAKAVVEAVENLKKQYSLDSTRFIIGGFSIGGAGTYHLIEFMPNYWAAACPVAAGGSADSIEEIAKTPIWHHQGTNDNGGAALIRMDTSLVNHHHPTLRVDCDMVVNTPAGWLSEIQKGTRPQDIIFKNAKPSYDSVSKAVDAGVKYVFQMITGANHEDSRLNANHNPLLAKWAFSKVKGGAVKVSFVPVSSRLSGPIQSQYGAFLTFVRPADVAADRIFTLLGQTCRGHDARGNFGTPTILIQRVPDRNAVRQK
jgi:poly(3-hydroxybutyrate) depolymerase